ncbi:hypothetical protein [Pasteurella oralis]|uniref:hypothetical protein n=1 Tax=Pasteurella oralis TaxID=1071947 RepID=UPI000C7979EA|nr:hypothetical protein [Pasteurella oralis]
MPINFTKILQDSWNFIQNQRQLVLTFVLAFFISDLFINVLLGLMTPIEAVTNNNEELTQIFGMDSATPNIAILLLVHQLIYLFIATWCLLSIHQVSQNHSFSLSISITIVLKRFIGVLLINIILLAPIIIGVSEIFLALVVNKTQPSIFSSLSMGLGLYLFIRFCLTSVHYITNHITISQAFQTTWQAGVKRVTPLFLYYLIIHFLLPLLMRHISIFNINLIFETIIDGIRAFLTLFSLVFTYRFYTIFMQKA